MHSLLIKIYIIIAIMHLSLGVCNVDMHIDIIYYIYYIIYYGILYYILHIRITKELQLLKSHAFWCSEQIKGNYIDIIYFDYA